MTTSVLGSVTLGYTPFWNRRRALCGVRLLVEAQADGTVDARHFLAALADLWPAAGANVVLRIQTPALLHDLLEHASASGPWIEIDDRWLAEALNAGRVRRAAQRGVPLVWRGVPGQTPSATVATLFRTQQHQLTPQQALDVLRGGRSGTAKAGFIFEGMANPALVDYALDRQHAWGVLGWPAEEVLHGYRLRQVQPSQALLQSLVQAIDADASLESLERLMGHEPLLSYRFLRWVNSASLHLRQDIGSLRQGLMTLGLARLRVWLQEQQAHASTDHNLDPVRTAMVLRARIMERLADAGAEDELRREVFLCGLFSQLDLLLGEPQGAALHRLPLPGRIASAIVGQTGPYAPWLEVATALESGSTYVIREVCRAHDMPTEEVNRALLRTLAQPALVTTAGQPQRPPYRVPSTLLAA